jgi:hypothetical protein
LDWIEGCIGWLHRHTNAMEQTMEHLLDKMDSHQEQLTAMDLDKT